MWITFATPFEAIYVRNVYLIMTYPQFSTFLSTTVDKHICSLDNSCYFKYKR
ncbi:hypothetical protein LGAA44_80039 [Leuconostoc gasicomitatum]|nr:hypothetical protein LGAA44_80039 [Leuconostoc gasicomitatum]